MKRIALLSAIIGAVVAIGCAEADDDPAPDEPADQTGIGLTVDFVGESDVAGFEFTVAECSGTDELDEDKIVRQETKDLEDLMLPGMIPEFENNPFDEGSTHLFADYYTSLPVGCYDVRVQPVTDSGAHSEDCDVASEYGVEVEDGKTTEIVLISQCEGDGIGAVDAVAVLNHPPRIHRLKYEKFNLECDRVKICATASDPDGDPIEFQWQQIGGPDLLEGPSPIGDKSISCSSDDCDFEDYDDYIRDGHDKIKSCIEVRLGVAGDYHFRLDVFDLYWEDDRLVRFPDSSASFEFPVYAGEAPDIECPPKDEDGKKLYRR